MVNNLNTILELLEFESEDDFYFLQILKRKKEHPELGSNSYVVKTYQITSKESLQRYMPEIICLCDFHNARAGINLNKRSFEKTHLKVIQRLVNQLENKDHRSARKAYNSVCGLHSNAKEKRWIIDIDSKDENERSHSSGIMLMCDPPGTKVLRTIETKNGFHQITKPFNVAQFKEYFKQQNNYELPDIHKDNPTILYIP